jgi:hypothetical protein
MIAIPRDARPTSAEDCLQHCAPFLAQVDYDLAILYVNVLVQKRVVLALEELHRDLNRLYGNEITAAEAARYAYTTSKFDKSTGTWSGELITIEHNKNLDTDCASTGGNVILGARSEHDDE